MNHSDVQKSSSKVSMNGAASRPHSSGFKTFLNWFRKVENQPNEGPTEANDEAIDSSSTSSDSSTATVASFAFLHPNFYKPYGDALQPEKFISAGPYTDTYKRLIEDMNRRRKLDENLNLSKKYHLYSSGTLNRNRTIEEEGFYNTFSLPARNPDLSKKDHRRAASESSTYVRPHSFVHVKGKRKAPQPPSNTNSINRTLRKKRPAPAPPPPPPKEDQISPRLWFKRQFNDTKCQKTKKTSDNSKQQELPEVGFFRCSKFFEHKKNIFFDKFHEQNDNKVKRLSMLSNISELDREATEIINMKRKCVIEQQKGEEVATNAMSARDLITKFNKINDLSSKIEDVKNRNSPKMNENRLFPRTWECPKCLSKNQYFRLACLSCHCVRPPRKLEENVPKQNDASTSASADVNEEMNDPEKRKLHGGNSLDDKEKLKELLKEMKNSLPKRPKPQKIDSPLPIKKIEPPAPEVAPEIANAAPVIAESGHKISASAQTNAVLKRIETQNTYSNVEEIKKVVSKGKGKMVNNSKSKNSAKQLYRKLEKAISEGDDNSAAEIAKSLAQLKVHCTVYGPTTIIKPQSNVTVDIFVEDQDTHQGPIPLKIRRDMSIAELKVVAFRELNIPINIQRWIVGKQLAADDDKPITVYNNDNFENPLFLYVVCKGTKKENEEKPEEQEKVPSKEIPPVVKDIPSTSSSSANRISHYDELLNLDNQDLVRSVVGFECPICIAVCPPEEGVVLRDCLHAFCSECLCSTITFCEEAEVKCPYIDTQYSCDSVLQEREIKALVDKRAYDQHLAKSMSVAENKLEKTFHCKTPDCTGWCIYEDYVNEFKCPVCKAFNCLTCQAIHSGINCRQYQEQLKCETGRDAATGLQTKQMLEEMLNKGEAMACPSCQIVLMKKWGCDWLKCSMCKTEICWVTRGPRWGPSGKGDLSGGCQCGVNGVKCHPKCSYCH